MKHCAVNMIPKAKRLKFAIGTAGIPTTQGSSHLETTNEENAHQFLRYKGHCLI
jgi:hypothetical protein